MAAESSTVLAYEPTHKNRKKENIIWQKLQQTCIIVTDGSIFGGSGIWILNFTLSTLQTKTTTQIILLVTY